MQAQHQRRHAPHWLVSPMRRASAALMHVRAARCHRPTFSASALMIPGRVPSSLHFRGEPLHLRVRTWATKQAHPCPALHETPMPIHAPLRSGCATQLSRAGPALTGPVRAVCGKVCMRTSRVKSSNCCVCILASNKKSAALSTPCARVFKAPTLTRSNKPHMSPKRAIAMQSTMPGRSGPHLNACRLETVSTTTAALGKASVQGKLCCGLQEDPCNAQCLESWLYAQWRAHGCRAHASRTMA